MYRLKPVIGLVLLIVVIATVGLLISNNDGISGSTVIASVDCFENNDCNDHIEETEDICKNPGTDYSLCINKPIK